MIQEPLEEMSAFLTAGMESMTKYTPNIRQGNKVSIVVYDWATPITRGEIHQIEVGQFIF